MAPFGPGGDEFRASLEISDWQYLVRISDVFVCSRSELLVLTGKQNFVKSFIFIHILWKHAYNP